MRLVNKVFESMISPHLFKFVVVPFKSGIYGPEIDISGLQRLLSNNGSKKGDVMIKDRGMRVFVGYGERISKFAMSFEYDEKKLNYPPLKSDQEAITTFWGIYRWPHKQYNRFAQLAHLEQIADETNTLSAALKCITKANTLGLSIDSGLGWLSGPDTNTAWKARGHAHKVFGGNRFAPEPLKRFVKEAKSTSPISDLEDLSRERMLREAGLEGEELNAAIDLMRKTENPSAEAIQHTIEPHPASTSVLGVLEVPSRENTVAPNNSSSASDDDMFTTPIASDIDEARLHVDIPPESNRRPTSAEGKKPKTLDTCPLRPEHLSGAQKEVLLETMWAQQAFVQSYVISITDNSQVFSKVATLTIARIPDHFLQDLTRDSFWDSLSGLEKLHLGVIPSWRKVEKLATTYVQDIRVDPSQSLQTVYHLLNTKISKRKNIKTLHFEWLCGGEEAPGMFARNHHILAAPVVSTSMEMLNTTMAPIILALPYVRHLTFKNCWFSPHILKSFLEGFGEGKEKDLKLQTLIFDSVSLTAPIPTNTVPAPPTVPPANPQAQPVPNVNALAAINLPAQQVVVGQNIALAAQALVAGAHAGSSDEDEEDVSEPNDVNKYQPRHGSWVEIIEQFTPSHYKSLHFRGQAARDSNTEPSQLSLPLISSLRGLEFYSCGYIQLPLDIDQSMIRASTIDHTRRLVQAAKFEIKDAMLKPNEYTLGTIINQVNSIERWQLVNGYFLEMGWDDIAAYSTRKTESRLDGIRRPGQGRFTGSIHVTDVKP